MIAYLIRHGQPEYPTDKAGSLLVYGPDAPLSPAGVARITSIAHAILKQEGRPFNRLVTSPYQRARDTARVIAEVMHLSPDQISEDPRLRDTASTWPGTSLAEFLKAWEARTVFNDPHTLESLDELRSCMTAAINEHLARLDGEMVGFIVHGDPLRAWLYPPEKRFPSYRELVDQTFSDGDGVRMQVGPDGTISQHVIRDFTTQEVLRAFTRLH